MLRKPEHIRMAALDTWGLNGALGYNLGMRWGTALMFMDLADTFSADSFWRSIEYPFVIIHDPGDAVCNISGSRNMLQSAATPAHAKQLVEVPGYLHALLANCPYEMCDHVIRLLSS